MQIELACAAGSPHSFPIGGSSAGHVLKYYMDARVFFADQAIIVGVCRGYETPFIFAEWHETGAIHGRPISKAALYDLGIRL